MTTDQVIQLITALVPLIVTILGFIFHLKQKEREQIAHALEYALRMFKKGEMTSDEAKNHILSTGAVKETKAVEIMKEVEIRSRDGKPTIYKNNVIKGVGLEVDTSGRVTIYPEGLLNKMVHKVTKYLKKRF